MQTNFIFSLLFVIAINICPAIAKDQPKSRLPNQVHESHAQKYLHGGGKIWGGLESINFHAYKAMTSAAKGEYQGQPWLDYKSKQYVNAVTVIEASMEGDRTLERGRLYLTENFVHVPNRVYGSLKRLSAGEIDKALEKRKGYSYCVVLVRSYFYYEHDLEGVLGLDERGETYKLKLERAEVAEK